MRNSSISGIKPPFTPEAMEKIYAKAIETVTGKKASKVAQDVYVDGSKKLIHNPIAQKSMDKFEKQLNKAAKP